MNRILDRGENYQQLKGLPALAGIAAFPDAISKGLSIDECVGRLKRYRYALKRLHQIFNDHISSEPIYELKMVFSLHSHYCAEHVAALGTRVGEMREPPLGLDRVPDSRLGLLFDEIVGQRDTAQRIEAIYGLALPAMVRAMDRHIDETNPLADHPSVRVCRFALLELREMLDYGERAIGCLREADVSGRSAWIDSLSSLLAQAGGIDGTEAVPGHLAGVTIAPMCSAEPYEYDLEVRRDERFSDPFNMGVNAEIFLHTEGFDPAAKVLMLYFKRCGRSMYLR